jgi:hypothetical protein
MLNIRRFIVEASKAKDVNQDGEEYDPVNYRGKSKPKPAPARANQAKENETKSSEIAAKQVASMPKSNGVVASLLSISALNRIAETAATAGKVDVVKAIKATMESPDRSTLVVLAAADLVVTQDDWAKVVNSLAAAGPINQNDLVDALIGVSTTHSAALVIAAVNEVSKTGIAQADDMVSMMYLNKGRIGDWADSGMSDDDARNAFVSSLVNGISKPPQKEDKMADDSMDSIQLSDQEGVDDDVYNKRYGVGQPSLKPGQDNKFNDTAGATIINSDVKSSVGSIIKSASSAVSLIKGVPQEDTQDVASMVNDSSIDSVIESAAKEWKRVLSAGVKAKAGKETDWWNTNEVVAKVAESIPGNVGKDDISMVFVSTKSGDSVAIAVVKSTNQMYVVKKSNGNFVGDVNVAKKSNGDVPAVHVRETNAGDVARMVVTKDTIPSNQVVADIGSKIDRAATDASNSKAQLDHNLKNGMVVLSALDKRVGPTTDMKRVVINTIKNLASAVAGSPNTDVDASVVKSVAKDLIIDINLEFKSDNGAGESYPTAETAGVIEELILMAVNEAGFVPSYTFYSNIGINPSEEHKKEVAASLSKGYNGVTLFSAPIPSMNSDRHSHSSTGQEPKNDAVDMSDLPLPLQAEVVNLLQDIAAGSINLSTVKPKLSTFKTISSRVKAVENAINSYEPGPSSEAVFAAASVEGEAYDFRPELVKKFKTLISGFVSGKISATSAYEALGVTDVDASNLDEFSVSEMREYANSLNFNAAAKVADKNHQPKEASFVNNLLKKAGIEPTAEKPEGNDYSSFGYKDKNDMGMDASVSQKLISGLKDKKEFIGRAGEMTETAGRVADGMSNFSFALKKGIDNNVTVGEFREENPTTLATLKNKAGVAPKEGDEDVSNTSGEWFTTHSLTNRSDFTDSVREVAIAAINLEKRGVAPAFDMPVIDVHLKDDTVAAGVSGDQTASAALYSKVVKSLSGMCGDSAAASAIAQTFYDKDAKRKGGNVNLARVFDGIGSKLPDNVSSMAKHFANTEVGPYAAAIIYGAITRRGSGGSVTVKRMSKGKESKAKNVAGDSDKSIVINRIQFSASDTVDTVARRLSNDGLMEVDKLVDTIKSLGSPVTSTASRKGSVKAATDSYKKDVELDSAVGHNEYIVNSVVGDHGVSAERNMSVRKRMVGPSGLSIEETIANNMISLYINAFMHREVSKRMNSRREVRLTNDVVKKSVGIVKSYISNFESVFGQSIESFSDNDKPLSYYRESIVDIIKGVKATGVANPLQVTLSLIKEYKNFVDAAYQLSRIGSFTVNTIFRSHTKSGADRSNGSDISEVISKESSSHYSMHRPEDADISTDELTHLGKSRVLAYKTIISGGATVESVDEAIKILSDEVNGLPVDTADVGSETSVDKPVDATEQDGSEPDDEQDDNQDDSDTNTLPSDIEGFTDKEYLTGLIADEVAGIESSDVDDMGGIDAAVSEIVDKVARDKNIRGTISDSKGSISKFKSAITDYVTKTLENNVNGDGNENSGMGVKSPADIDNETKVNLGESVIPKFKIV